MSARAMFWRHQQSFVDRSHVVAIEAILEVVRVDKGKMLSTEAMSTGAMFCRQEPCCGDSNRGGCPYRQRQDVWAAWELGAPVWAACELVWTAWGPSDMATRPCFVDRSNVDRSIPGGRPNRVLSREAMSTGAMVWRQEQSFVDRSHVVAIEAILEVVRVDKGKMLSTEAMSSSAQRLFSRQ